MRTFFSSFFGRLAPNPSAPLHRRNDRRSGLTSFHRRVRLRSQPAPLQVGSCAWLKVLVSQGIGKPFWISAVTTQARGRLLESKTESNHFIVLFQQKSSACCFNSASDAAQGEEGICCAKAYAGCRSQVQPLQGQRARGRSGAASARDASPHPRTSSWIHDPEVPLLQLNCVAHSPPQRRDRSPRRLQLDPPNCDNEPVRDLQTALDHSRMGSRPLARRPRRAHEETLGRESRSRLLG